MAKCYPGPAVHLLAHVWRYAVLVDPAVGRPEELVVLDEPGHWVADLGRGRKKSRTSGHKSRTWHQPFKMEIAAACNCW